MSCVRITLSYDDAAGGRLPPRDSGRSSRASIVHGGLDLASYPIYRVGPFRSRPVEDRAGGRLESGHGTMDERRKSTSCRLIRENGAEWSVRELELSDTPPRALAVPAGAENGGAGEPRELVLTRGDRLEWLSEDGTLVWATRIPLKGETGEADDDVSEGPSAGAA